MQVIYECSVAGVSFDNDDGTSRQAILEKLMDYQEMANLRLEERSGTRPGPNGPEPFTGIAVVCTSLGHWPSKRGYAESTAAAELLARVREALAVSDPSKALCAAHGLLHGSGEQTLGWIPEKSGDLERLRGILAEREQGLSQVTAQIVSMGRAKNTGPVGMNIRILAMPRRVRV